MINDPLDPARLRWACRRGMLELDVLLSKFLDQAYPKLTAAEQVLFAKLLSCQDTELFHWFLGQGAPEDPGLASMVDKVRKHARH